MVIVSLFLGPIGPILMAVGFLYFFESGWLLKKYPEMPGGLAMDLQQARTRFLWLGLLPLIIYTVLAIIIGTVLLAG